MRVILRQNVENLGVKGDIVNVAPGYGRNYLIPMKIALEVTSSNVRMIEIEQQALKKAAEKERASYQGIIEKLNATILVFKRKAGEKDVIFGSVSSADVREALHEQGFDIDKKKILLDEPIKRLGNYTVPIKIFHEDRAEVKVEVVTEEGEAIAEKEEKDVEEKAEGEARAGIEEEQKKDTVEVQEEKRVKTKKGKKKKGAEEAEAIPDREEKEAKSEDKEKKEEILSEKGENTEDKGETEEVKEKGAEEQKEAAEAKAEETKEEPPEAEKKKGKTKKEKKKKKKGE
ncbi:MAG: 50S ribosomal protein L9 [Candidatus Aminicenantes bacterium]|jgi:large subunit ribosomal protein L9